MNNKIGRILLAGLIISILLGNLVGCVKQIDEETQEGKDLQGQNLDIEKPEKITMMINIGILEEDGLNEWARDFQVKTGIELEIQSIRGAEYYQKLELAFASNQAPDVFTIGDGKLPIYASQGALMDLTQMARESKIIQEMDQSVIEGSKISGSIYGMPYENGGGPVTYLRQDWLDQLGKEPPRTYDEFIDVLRAFKSISPDIIPLTAPGLVAKDAKMYLTQFYQDANPDFVQIDGEWVDGMVQPNMRDALTRLRDAYAEGLIDTEIVTNKTSTCREKWYAGQVGAFSYWAGNWNVLLEDRVKAVDPNAKVIAIPAISGTHYDIRIPAVMAISSVTKNPKGVFKYLIEYMHDGGEGSILFRHGVEGLHWEQRDGYYVHLPKVSNPSEVYDKAFITPALGLEPIKEPGYQHQLDPRVISSAQLINKDGIQQISVPVSELLGKIGEDLLDLRQKTVSMVVLGEMDLELALEMYKLESQELGINQVLRELNAEEGGYQ